MQSGGVQSNLREGLLQFNKLARLEVARISLKPASNPNTNFFAYGANTTNGIIRTYNEDRISIVLDLKKPGHDHATPNHGSRHGKI